MSGLAARLAGAVGGFRLDATLEAPAGAVTALVGPSGSGKSTLLRALAGLVRLEGEVRVGDAVWRDGRRWTPPHRRAVGLVFQHAALLPHLCVRANIDYGRRRAGAPAAETDALAERLGVGALMDRMPGGLSGGERQRVAVARALATRPALLLLDEPLSGVDAPAKAALLPELRAVFVELAVPVIYVTHDPAEVARIADRVLHLRDGRIVGAPEAPSDAERLAGRPPQEIARLAALALRAGLEPG